MGRKLYIAHVPHTATIKTLRAALAAGGRKVVSVDIPIDSVSQQPRGFALAEMGSEGDAKAAIAELHGAKLGGRVLGVLEQIPRAPRAANAPRTATASRTGGGGGGGGQGGGRARRAAEAATAAATAATENKPPQ